MRGDLNDQFQRAQSSVGNDDNSEKIIIIVAAVVFLSFVAGIIGFTIFAVKTADKIMNTPAATNIDPSAASKLSGQVSQIYDYGTSGTTGSYKSKLSSNTNFEYGTVTGTSYYSKFSGVQFNAPSDWSVTSYASTYPGSTPKDISASGDGISIVIQYELMSYRGYETVADALASTEEVIESTGSTILDDGITAKWGGNKFKGILYKKTISYVEILYAEVEDYMLKITITTSKEDNIGIGRSYFN